MSGPGPRFDIGLWSAHWMSVDDDVMGGHSRGSAVLRDGVLRFAGALSLEDDGGFASIRARGAFELRGASGMRLRVLGDGRAYQLRIATDARHHGANVSWRADFSTCADEWINVDVAFAHLRPTCRGTVLDGPALDLSKLEEIGLLIGDGRAGDFALQIASMAPLGRREMGPAAP